MKEAAHCGGALFVPNALAASFAFEEANCLSLLRIEELMGELKGGCAGRAVKKPLARGRLPIVVHRRFDPASRR